MNRNEMSSTHHPRGLTYFLGRPTRVYVDRYAPDNRSRRRRRAH